MDTAEAPASSQKTIIIGAGPVGSLAAIYAARRGETVELYELRPDPRKPSSSSNVAQSINLALSERGIFSILHAQRYGLHDTVLRGSIPMHGRMIHGKDTKGNFTQQAQLYDAHGRFIRAIDRSRLSRSLLDEAETFPNVKIFWSHKLTGANLDSGLAWFEKTSGDRSIRGEEIEVAFDFMVGADGAHSAARFHMMKFVRMDYHQEYIDTMWCEFKILPKDSANPEYAISPHHLHIWPAGDSMFIAIPNIDSTFTCTLFIPASKFAALEAVDTEAAVEQFFIKYFPGVVPDLIKPLELFRQFKTNPHLPLISIKCTPHVYSSKCVIVGDAAHAMVPFYGQGMNAGLEDVRVLFITLDKYISKRVPLDRRNAAREEALREYSAQRVPDAHAINDLALKNYVEMRSSVRSPVYRARKKLEELVSVYLPSLGWRTQYSRVSFENQRYSEVVKDVRRQGTILAVLMTAVGLGALTTVAFGVLAWRRSRHGVASVQWLTSLFKQNSWR